ncbi:uracil-DNA glycosylase [Desulfotignum phosphitoxidans]|uniref:Uracil-DNA glycosylase n=1 Tax=Desulfotignum phosphitoxidans DSM 13687 TaxID=1286635 RepID=S0G6U8_9BACT|nr:uracil-DNA glycosylase [Desulfotignum phosphitoxidans]EMS80602.1 uracil-DNA glycosylase [Desulfotignum phosphitoxidans DSM 13687]
MTPLDNIPFLTSSVTLLDIIDDLSGYLRCQKQMGLTRVPLSPRSLEILAAWGRPVVPRKPFRHAGPASANVVLVDGAGTFFMGEPGALLKKILAAMKLAEDKVCVCNAPDAEQVFAFLQSVQPVVVIALGDAAARTVTGIQKPVAAIRGKFFDIRGFSVMPTFHPSQLLKDPGLKRPVWEDMQQVMQIHGIVS